MTEGVLTGKVAVITGGSGSIGAASARRLAADGATVVLMARNGNRLREAATKIEEHVPGAHIEIVEGDVQSEADVRRAMIHAEALQGRLDIVVATVGGGGRWRPLLSYEPEEFRSIVDRNIMSTFLAMRHSAPRMRSGGSIICLSAMIVRVNVPYLAAAAAAKGGVEGLMRAGAEELAAAGIRVNAVRPGLIPGGNTGILFEDGLIDKAIEQIPLAPHAGRVGLPEDVAEAVRYLAGPESAWVTGQSFAVDGGQELRKGVDYGEVVRRTHPPDALRIIDHPDAL